MQSFNERWGSAIDDFNQYFSNTLVNTPEGVMLISEVVRDHDEDDNYIPSIYGRLFNDGIGTSLHIDLSEEDFLYEPIFPELGNINLEHTCVRLQRQASRNYKRSLARNDIHLIDLTYELREILGLPSLSRETYLNNAHVLSQIINPKYNTPEEAYTALTEGKAVSRALSSRVYMSIQVFNDDLSLGYKDIVVGTVTKDRDRIVFNLFRANAHLREELSDLAEVRVQRV